MAKLNILNVIVSLFLAISPMVLAQEVEVEITPSSESPFTLLSESEPGLYAYVEKCAAITGPKCGEEILYGSLMEKPVTLECCKKLVLMGKKCDDALLKLILEFPDRKEQKEEAWAGSNRLWEKCNLAVQAASPSSPPFISKNINV